LGDKTLVLKTKVFFFRKALGSLEVNLRQKFSFSSSIYRQAKSMVLYGAGGLWISPSNFENSLRGEAEYVSGACSK
jgi:hypothetical protein